MSEENILIIFNDSLLCRETIDTKKTIAKQTSHSFLAKKTHTLRDVKKDKRFVWFKTVCSTVHLLSPLVDAIDRLIYFVSPFGFFF